MIDAYVRPAVSGYLERLESGLGEDGFAGECLITTSAGRLRRVLARRVRGRSRRSCRDRWPARSARARCASSSAIKLAITGDVGGTSFDTALLVDGRPQRQVRGRGRRHAAADAVGGRPLGRRRRRVDRLRRAGPAARRARAAPGAVPGPVCYGARRHRADGDGRRRGARDARSPDACQRPAARRRRGPRRRSRASRTSSDSTPSEAAQGVLRVAGASMAGAMRAVSVEVGEDPRDGALIAYGGAGPLLASLLARELAIEHGRRSRTTPATSPPGDCSSRTWCGPPR